MATALVTGAAGGIGGAIVEALESDGHRVAGTDISPAGGIIEMDVTDTASVDAAIATVESELGPIEILVNSAGWDEFHPFVQTDEQFWDKVIEINYKGVLRTCKRALPKMVENNYGRVINIASD